MLGYCKFQTLTLVADYKNISLIISRAGTSGGSQLAQRGPPECWNVLNIKEFSEKLRSKKV
jgi:hypothetical protein